MNKDLLNILSNSNKDIDNQKLMDYLGGKLSEQEKHEVEEWMAASDFSQEAMEGLEEFESRKELKKYVDGLNQDLTTYIQKKKNRREKKRIKEYPWTYIAIFLLISLCIIAYVVIRELR